MNNEVVTYTELKSQIAKMREEIAELKQQNQQAESQVQDLQSELLQIKLSTELSFKTLSVAMLIVDIEGNIQFWNKQFTQMFGLPDFLIQKGKKDSLLGYVVQQLQNPKDFLAKVMHLYRTPELDSYDILELIDQRIIERFSVPLRINEQINARIWLFRDITAQKLFEKHSKEVEFKFKSLSENSNDFIMRIDEKFRYLYVNSAGLKFFDVSDKQIIGKSLREIDIYKPEECEKWEEQINQVFATKLPEYRQVNLEYKSKTYILDRRIIPEFDESGRVISVLAIFRDITMQKSAENQLRQKNAELLKAQLEIEHSQAKYKQIFDNTLDQIFIFDVTAEKRLKLIDYNPTLRKLVGDLNIAEDKYIEDCLAPEIYKQVIHNYQRCLIEKQIITYEEVIQLGDDTLYFSTQLIPIIDKHGNIYRMVGITRNITENKKLTHQLQEQNEVLRELNSNLLKAKEKAEESDRLKTAFLENISHEIRTPMNGIVGFSDLLKDNSISEQEQAELIELLQINWSRMLNTINDIIEMSKIDTEQIDINYAECNLLALLNNIIARFKPEITAKGLDFIFRNKESLKLLSEFESDSEKIDIILTILMKNAIKFTHKGSIELGVNLRGEELILFVRDTGIGIHKDNHELIFEKFRQGDEHLSRNYEGMGLGLSIAKKYIEVLNGKIWVISASGVGSTFYISIPMRNSK